MKRALIVIDYTNDIVAPTGKLTAGAPAQKLAPAIAAATSKAAAAGDLVVFAVDCHQPNDHYHPESKLFPPHNLVGTAGRQLYGQLEQVYASIKGQENVVWLDKRRYSAFAGTALDQLLRERKVDEVVLCGVLTDICVLHTAISAYNLSYRIQVLANATASLTPERHAWALTHMHDVLGAQVIK